MADKDNLKWEEIILFGKFSHKIVWKWKNWTERGSRIPGASSGSANGNSIRSSIGQYSG